MENEILKRYNNLYNKIISFENVLNASRKARKGKRYKFSTANFEYNIERNILKIIDQLKAKTYEPGGYTDFYIYDPKKRLISAAPYFDRVIHHALMNVIEPIFTKTFIYDTYACIKGRGTHMAVKRYRAFQNQNRFVLKCDIKKYFQNINHEVLFQKVAKKIKCRDTLWILKKIIDSRSDCSVIEYFPGDNLLSILERPKGIPIGNLTSQFFANLYLNDFDHFIKEQKKARYYIRYCDDFVIFGNSKQRLNDLKQEISDQFSKLRLKLHENKCRVYRTSDGVDFLGYRIFPNYSLVRKRIVKRFRKKLRKMVLEYRNGTLEFDKIHCSIQSWIGHVQHADSYKIRREVFSSSF